MFFFKLSCLSTQVIENCLVHVNCLAYICGRRSQVDDLGTTSYRHQTVSLFTKGKKNGFV